jgi:glyoxylase-like metal-dependent hydrolase (beta-lactamase superfamily II)
MESSMGLLIDTLVLGPLETNCYVIRHGGACVVVDPGPRARPLIDHLRRTGAQPSAIWLTHGHGDHIAGVAEVRQAFEAVRVVAPAADEFMLTSAEANLSAAFGVEVVVRADELIRPGGHLDVGATQWQVLDTSGHTPGGVSYYCQAHGVVLTGDALFAGGVGRTDLGGGDWDRLHRNLLGNLLALDDETRVLPGHGPETTIGLERSSNPFL